MDSRKQLIWGRAAASPTLDDLRASREQMNRAGAEFLKIDLETARTFVEIARHPYDDSYKKRNCRSARKAYDTVSKLIDKVHWHARDEVAVKRELRRLKTELEGLGETF
jgi:hypothetical protein